VPIEYATGTSMGSIIAGMGGFTQKPYFSADEKAATAPTVSF